MCEAGRDGVLFMCARVHDMAPCCNTVGNEAIGF